MNESQYITFQSEGNREKSFKIFQSELAFFLAFGCRILNYFAQNRTSYIISV